MKLSPLGRRSAFTLIELLVVIGLSIALLTLGVFLVPSINDKRQVARGADQLQGWLLLGKQRAIRDQMPRGYRLTTDELGNYSLLLPIEIPDPIEISPTPGPQATISVPNRQYDPNNPSSPAYIGQPATLTFAVGTANDFNNLGDVIQGDKLTIQLDSSTAHTVLTPPYSINSPAGTFKVDVTLGGVIDEATVPPPTAATGSFTGKGRFVFYRQAQPIAGESPLRLPDRVVIDQASSLNFMPDIMFSRQGQIMNATGGRVVLWVKHIDNLGEPTLMTIYARSGGIAAHAPGPAGQDYQFTQDGLDSGL